MPKGPWGRLVAWVTGLAGSGWFFHRSETPDFLIYSKGYLKFLAALVVVYLIFLVALAVIQRLLQWKTARNVLVLLAIASLMSLWAASGLYYSTQSHPFDPFVQIAFPDFSAVSKNKAPDTLRILVLGGSTSQGTYPDPMGQTLGQALSPRKVEVMNGAVAWYTTKHSLINYATEARDYKPDIVLIMHAFNDMVRSFSPPDFAVGEYNARWSHYYGPAIRGARPPSFGAYLYQKHFKVIGDKWFSMVRVNEEDFPLEVYRSLPSYERHLTALVELAKRDGAEVVLMTEPTLYSMNLSAEDRRLLDARKHFCRSRHSVLFDNYPSVASLERAMTAYNQVVKNVAASQGALLIDADPLIPKSGVYFTDDLHYTPEGISRMAQIVASKLLAHEQLKSNDSQAS